MCWCAGVLAVQNQNQFFWAVRQLQTGHVLKRLRKNRPICCLGLKQLCYTFMREIDLISQLVRTSVTEYDEEGVMGMFSIIQPILLPPLFGCSTRGQRGR